MSINNSSEPHRGEEKGTGYDDRTCEKGTGYAEGCEKGTHCCIFSTVAWSLVSLFAFLLVTRAVLCWLRFFFCSLKYMTTLKTETSKTNEFDNVLSRPYFCRRSDSGGE